MLPANETLSSIETNQTDRDPFIRSYLMNGEVSAYRVETKENFFEYVARVMLQNGEELEFLSFLLTPVAATSLLLRLQGCCCKKEEEEE